ncbi:MAG TPA: peptide-methionine (R)-S-oxide reductase MsrB [Sphingomonas sp.]|nr:peptide-methionine (R)-S-oxide reductase MsrB [Sphingomonas sp.]
MTRTQDRRTFLATGALALAGAAVAGFPRPALATSPRPLRLSDAEWRRRLSPQAYAVLRRGATERPFSSPLNSEHRGGTFLCAGCALPLFAARTKFDSGTGWPSFWSHLPDAITQKRDTSLFMDRTEVRCARCDGHLGHVFNDGPRPTSLRYCMNGVALRFAPARRG